MYRLLLVIKFMEKGLLNKAYRVLYNYYGTTELYKGDYLKTLLLIDQYINGQISLNDVKRSVNAFDGKKPSKFEVKYGDEGAMERYIDYNLRVADISKYYKDAEANF